ncbi:AAA family ATPase [Nostoc minutum NIES-26]|uniref:AAA family ATPase n=1 Tax=Nostoc minutum NIES-26 TaxID=1844469 RepID=A0A367S2I7_9NOSO|nr:AAA family ATPase [Nostoc minutum NIES-26]
MPMTSLFQRLSAERNRRFVGRGRELELFLHTIASRELPFHILQVCGPGGVGKTSLMKQFLRFCERSKIPAIYVEARNIEAAPESFISTLHSLMELNESDSPLHVLAQRQERNVILIDTYEAITQLDEWLREVFLPHLSVNTLIVIAGRNPPSSPWCSDPGWQALMHTLSLRNLTPEESQTYLTIRDIPTTQHQAILDFTHGHPLALSLVAEVFAQAKEISFQAESAPNVVKTLLERFVKEVPTPAHRMALEACAVVRLTTEASLNQILAVPENTSASEIQFLGEILDVHDLFEWLRGLSFIESGQWGLFPHDLAREVLIADLRWRNPEFYTELHHRARQYYTKRLGQTQGAEKHRVLLDYIFLHRDNSDIRSCFTWGEQSGLLIDSLRETDTTALLLMVAQYEGEESAKIAAHWLQRQPQNVVVFRDSHSEPAGFAMMVALHTATVEDLTADPGAIASWQYLQTHAALRKSEGATIFRFWMARDTYQVVSPTQSLIFINFVQYFQKTPGLAYTFLPCAQADTWAAMLNYFDLVRLPEADFTVGGRYYGVYGHDWRIVSPTTWQEILAQKEVGTAVESVDQTPASEPLLVFSQPEFVEAVQNVLRNFNRPDALQNNPLVRSRSVCEVHSRLMSEQVATKASMSQSLKETLLSEKSPSGHLRDSCGRQSQRVKALQHLVKQAVESLQSSPRDEKLYRAVYRTYLNPAPTQEQAAELLDLPFSTYRRHLKAGVMRVADILWRREIN